MIRNILILLVALVAASYAQYGYGGYGGYPYGGGYHGGYHRHHYGGYGGGYGYQEVTVATQVVDMVDTHMADTEAMEVMECIGQDSSECFLENNCSFFDL
ncbi:Protein CBG26977 [Caenorhabditis briggsae]|uniref:Protein CBG26977 n=1 Tax=Caenorhabditis briggsae TaxID=6238 RepID=B6IEU3_CAEBR|nr:Protein CBG26977 [Caenorhabditis briggsae]CAR98423.1 Protein CBG26977 [Caenorhabditis briggsae]